MHGLRTTIGAGLLTLGAGLLGTSCVDNDSSFFVYGVMNISSSQCLAQPDASAVLTPAGILDRAFATGYEAALLVGSHLTQRGSREKLRTETARLEVTGARITLYGTKGSVKTFDGPATGLVNPASGTDPGLAAVFARLVRAEDMDDLGPDGQIIARIKVLGKTLGGQDIESGDFDFPISVCTGCLVVYPSGSINQDTKLCETAASTTTTDSTAQVCFQGQDQAFPCTDCASYNPICRDPLKNTYLNPAP
jgi:hypothetical protein